MPRSKSAEAVLARQLVGVPTPWCNASWVYDGQNIMVRFRLWQKKRGMTLFVETAKDSPNYSNRKLPVRLQRTGLLPMHRSGLILIRMSQADPTCAPVNPRYQWNKSHREYMQGKVHLRVVAEHLDRFLNPRRGRPRKPPIIGEPRTNHAAGAYLLRRRELVEFTTQVKDLLEPVVERVSSARRMRGYEEPRRTQIKRAVLGLQNQVRELHTLVYFDAPPGQARPLTPAAPTYKPLPVQLPTFDFDLEPTPVGISYNETPPPGF